MWLWFSWVSVESWSEFEIPKAALLFSGPRNTMLILYNVKGCGKSKMAANYNLFSCVAAR